MIGVFVQPLRLTTQTSGGDCSIFVEKIKGSFVNQNIQGSGSFENCRLNNPNRQSSGNIFHRMNGNIDLTIYHGNV